MNKESAHWKITIVFDYVNPLTQTSNMSGLWIDPADSRSGTKIIRTFSVSELGDLPQRMFGLPYKPAPLQVPFDPFK